MNLTKLRRSPLLYVLLAALALIVVGSWLRSRDDSEKLSLSELEQHIAQGDVATAKIGDRSHDVTGKLSDGTKFRSSFQAEYGDELTAELLAHKVDVSVDLE